MRFMRWLMLATIGLGAACAGPTAAPAKQDNVLGLACLKIVPQGVNGGSYAVSLTEGDTAWGACSAFAGPTKSETWWKRPAAGAPTAWVILGPPVAVGASADDVAAKNYGVPPEAIRSIVAALKGHEPPHVRFNPRR